MKEKLFDDESPSSLKKRLTISRVHFLDFISAVSHAHDSRTDDRLMDKLSTNVMSNCDNRFAISIQIMMIFFTRLAMFCLFHEPIANFSAVRLPCTGLGELLKMAKQRSMALGLF